MQEILEYKLIEIGNFKLSVYNILLIIFIIIVTKTIIRMIELLVKKKLTNKGWIDPNRSFSITQVIKYFVYIFSFTLIIQSLGINISILIASSAALLVGIGLGLQNIFRDVVSGIILLFEREIEVNDVIEIEGIIGIVKEINIRTSKVKTRDDIMIIVPNSKLVSDKVINWSNSNKKTRFPIFVKVPYGTDTELVKNILVNCANAHPDISKFPEPIVWMKNFGEYFLEFELLFWTMKTWEVENTRSDLRFAIEEALKENNIKIPVPQRDVTIKSKEEFKTL
jgi:small-conductance mechanosensitive channel